jgi:aspartate kinase
MENALIVQKYGGSSLQTPERIKEIAKKIAARAKEDTQIIVTVSAMGGTTDELMRLANGITSSPSQRELDMLLTVGERISMALLSMALNAIGRPAISFTGSQSGIVTDMSHNRALIEEIRAGRIQEALGQGRVVIVAGFQGVSRNREITTLGRGGSDTTAVGLAAKLQASACEIYSDYPGVFSADPRWVRTARRIPEITYEEMLELAALGAKVLHYRAAEIARRIRVPLVLLSSFEDGKGTRVIEAHDMETFSAKSITSEGSVSMITLRDSRGESGFDEIIGRLERSELRLIIYQRSRGRGGSSLNLVIDRGDTAAFHALVGEPVPNGLSRETRDDVGSVTVVGHGFARSPQAVCGVERALGKADIPVHLTGSTSQPIGGLRPLPLPDGAVDPGQSPPTDHPDTCRSACGSRHPRWSLTAARSGRDGRHGEAQTAPPCGGEIGARNSGTL